MSSSLPNFGTTNIPTAVPSNNTVVIPPITIPSNFTLSPNNAVSLPGPQLNKVSSMDGAKQFQTVPNAMYALFEEDDDVFYLKITDKNNYPEVLKRFRFFEEPEPEPMPPPEPATKEDINALLKEVESLKDELRTMKEGNNNGKQYIRSKNNYKPNGGQPTNVPNSASIPEYSESAE